MLNSNKYFGELLQCVCASDLLLLDAFKTTEELTRAFAIFDLVWEGGTGLDLQDPDTALIVFGNGKRPGVAATFAFRSKWMCYSIDYRHEEWADDNSEDDQAFIMEAEGERDVERLVVLPKMIGDVTLDIPQQKVVLVVLDGFVDRDDVLRPFLGSGRSVNLIETDGDEPCKVQEIQ